MNMERRHTEEKMVLERNASTHEKILKLAAGFDSSMSWQERVKQAT
jgi:hypothetical protein